MKIETVAKVAFIVLFQENSAKPVNEENRKIDNTIITNPLTTTLFAKGFLITKNRAAPKKKLLSIQLTLPN
ncbi:MAG: hypothetical protein V3U89_00720 [Methylophilaceae bacterium]